MSAQTSKENHAGKRRTDPVEEHLKAFEGALDVALDRNLPEQSVQRTDQHGGNDIHRNIADHKGAEKPGRERWAITESTHTARVPCLFRSILLGFHLLLRKRHGRLGCRSKYLAEKYTSTETTAMTPMATGIWC